MSIDGGKSSLTVQFKSNNIIKYQHGIVSSFTKKPSHLSNVTSHNPTSEKKFQHHHAPLRERLPQQFVPVKNNKYSRSLSTMTHKGNGNNKHSSSSSTKSYCDSSEVRTSSPRPNQAHRISLLKDSHLSPIPSPKRPRLYDAKSNIKPKKPRLANSHEAKRGGSVDLNLSHEDKQPDSLKTTDSTTNKLQTNKPVDSNNCNNNDTVSKKSALWNLISDSNIAPQFKVEPSSLRNVQPTPCSSSLSVSDTPLLNHSDHVEMTPTKSLSEADQHSFHLTSPPSICSQLPSHILHRKLNKKSAFAKLKFVASKSEGNRQQHHPEEERPLIRSLLKQCTQQHRRYVSDSVKLAADEAHRTAILLSQSQKLRPPPPPPPPPPVNCRIVELELEEESDDLVVDMASNVLDIGYDREWRHYAFSESVTVAEMVQKARHFLIDHSI